MDLPVPVNPNGKRETMRGFKIGYHDVRKAEQGFIHIADPTARVNMHFPRLSEMGLSRRARNAKTIRNILAERPTHCDRVGL